jgi:hypothetical protein
MENACYLSVQNLLSSSLLSKNLNIRVLRRVFDLRGKKWQRLEKSA